MTVLQGHTNIYLKQTSSYFEELNNYYNFSYFVTIIWTSIYNYHGASTPSSNCYNYSQLYIFLYKNLFIYYRNRTNILLNVKDS